MGIMRWTWNRSSASFFKFSSRVTIMLISPSVCLDVQALLQTSANQNTGQMSSPFAILSEGATFISLEILTFRKTLSRHVRLWQSHQGTFGMTSMVLSPPPQSDHNQWLVKLQKASTSHLLFLESYWKFSAQDIQELLTCQYPTAFAKSGEKSPKASRAMKLWVQCSTWQSWPITLQQEWGWSRVCWTSLAPKKTLMACNMKLKIKATTCVWHALQYKL